MLAVIPALVAAIAISQSALDSGQRSLEYDAKKSLIAIRDITAAQITTYIETIENQSISMSENLMTIEAMQDFSQTFKNYSNETNSNQSTNVKAELASYYSSQFAEEYYLKNGQRYENPESLMFKLDAKALNLQHRFIHSNPHPLGNKHLLVSADDGSSYDREHQKYHQVFKNFIERFGYYDLFLVDDETGDIVYSVFKELDYATSLKTGPFADSGIAQAFAGALKSNNSKQSFIADFAPYLPSYNAPASFIATPIFDGQRRVGVLILQMPVDKINSVMTHKQLWEDTGLGKSGETYLVGPDYSMRSNGRFLLEDKKAYLDLMRELGVSENVIKDMDKKETSIGLQEVKTLGTESALNGETGFAIFDDYRQVSVLSAFKPISIGGLNWAIMSEIDEAEAFASVTTLQQNVNYLTLFVIMFAAIVGVILSWLLARTILSPVKDILTAVSDLAAGEGNLTKRIAIKGNDEIAELSVNINKFVEHLDKTFSDLIKSAMRLVPMAEELSEGNVEITKASGEQNQQIANVKSKLAIAKSSTEQVSSEANNILSLSEQGTVTVKEALNVFEATYQEINKLDEVIGNAASSIDSLKSESDIIENVIDVINTIAEQTNLLALNAAIEAARAGEAGRGFAVVADEVRALASRTRESTLEVSSMVHAIQSRTGTVVETMSVGKSSVDACNKQVDQAKEKLSQINQAMDKISQTTDAIGIAIYSQEQNFNHVATDFDGLDECFANSQKASDLTIQIGIDMSKMSLKLHGMVDQFILTDNKWSTGRRRAARIEDAKVAKIKENKVKPTQL